MQQTGSRIVTRRIISDSSFEADRPEAYQLFVYIDEEEFSCAVAEKTSKQFAALESWNLISEGNSVTEHIADAFENSSILNAGRYRKVICCSGFRHATLIPKPLYDPYSAEDQLRFATTITKNEEIFTDELRYVEAKNVFSIPSEIHEFIAGKFQNAEFHHTFTSLVDFILSEYRNAGEEVIVVNVHLNYIDIIITKGKMLLFANSFRFASPEELVYCILFVFEQLHINPENADLRFAGEVTTNDEHFILAGKYIKHISFMDRPSAYSYADDFASIASHLHLNLFSQLVCAS